MILLACGRVGSARPNAHTFWNLGWFVGSARGGYGTPRDGHAASSAPSHDARCLTVPDSGEGWAHWVGWGGQGVVRKAIVANAPDLVRIRRFSCVRPIRTRVGDRPRCARCRFSVAACDTADSRKRRGSSGVRCQLSLVGCGGGEQIGIRRFTFSVLICISRESNPGHIDGHEVFYH